MIRQYAGDDFEFEPHFTPHYRPWQQRLAFCPDGDVFKAAASGKLTVVTDKLTTFTETGVRTESGEEIEADIIVAATGFHLSVMGEIPFDVDGTPVNWHDTINYRGMMFTGVPNLLWVFGYFRASWTLRVDMLGDFVCNLLKHMDKIGAKRVEVALRAEDATCRSCLGSRKTTSTRTTCCVTCTVYRNGVPSRSGATIRTIGVNGTRSPRRTLMVKSSCTTGGIATKRILL